MKKLMLSLSLCCGITAFGQLSNVNGFKKNTYDLYEMTFKDVREAIFKYNYVSDKNGADTTKTVFNIMNNPIDFGYFKKDEESENMIVCFLFREGNKYKVMFGEVNANEKKYFFDIMNEKGEPKGLFYDPTEE